MALTKRIFYTLPELAKRWGMSEDDLIHMAAAGGLPLSISYKGYISGLPVLSCQGFLSIYPHDAAKFLLGNNPEVEISRFYDPDCDPNSPRKHLSPITLPENYENLEEAVQNAVPTKLKITRNGLVIMASAVIRLEAEQPELLAQGVPIVSTTSNEAKIAFPNGLASELRTDKTKPAASQPPIPSQEFESLTLAIDDWFDKNLDDLPIALRQRVERDFPPIPWDDLTADQRRSQVLQWDYLHDPATDEDRQFWWDLYARMRELEAQIANWKSAATPTASDILLKESRLKELQQEIHRMDLQQRQVRGDYYPERKSLDADRGVPTADYFAYPKAMKLLREKWEATSEELAAWIFLGPDLGGVAAYCNANELNPPPRFYFSYHMGEDYLSPLMACWFLQDDIDRFEPTDRYITGAALIERWSKQPSLRPEAFIRAKIAESRLYGIHPTFGLTQGTIENDTSFPPLSAGLFPMKEIELIEVEDALAPALVPVNSDAEPVKLDLAAENNKMPLDELIKFNDGRYLLDGAMIHRLMDAATPAAPRDTNFRREARKLETQAMYKGWQKAYRDLFKKHKHKNLSDVWCSQQIAKMDIAKGRDSETIRQHMKK